MSPIKRNKHSAGFKCTLIEYAKEHGNRATARKFGLCESLVRGWRRNEKKIVNMPKNKYAMRRGVSKKKKNEGESGSSVHITGLIPSRNEEVVVPNVEMRLSESSTKNGNSLSLMSTSDIVVKQEIIETEEEPNVFDDSSFNSSLTENPIETHDKGQTLCTSYMPHSESSISSAVTPPIERIRDVVMTTLPPCSSTNNVQYGISTHSFVANQGKASHNVPPALNTVGTLPTDQSVKPGLSSHVANSPISSVLNISGHKSSSSTEPITTGVSLSQVSTSSSLSGSGNEPKQTCLASDVSLPPRDRFDAYGEFIASKLRNLDPKSCNFIQTALADLLFKAELGMFSNTGSENNIVLSYKTNDVRKDTQQSVPHSQSENNCSSSGKENVHPITSSHSNEHIPPDLNLSSSEGPPRNETIQSRVHPLMLNPPYPPIPNNAVPECLLNNVPNQTRFTVNSWPPQTSNVPLNNQNPHQTLIPNQTGPPFVFPALNCANSWNDMPIQARTPFHMRPRDEFDNYGEFVSSKLRALDPRSCAYVQTALADLIFEAELGRFLSEGERSIFANKTNEILRNMPPANTSELNSLRNVVSNLSRFED